MAFQQGLSGLASSSKALDVAGNNIANASTVGFKSSSSHFADVYGASLQGGGGSQIGIGSTLSAVMQQYTQGNITSTNNPLDIAINGTGFFGMTQNGATSYTRNGQFHLDKNGYIVNDQNRMLLGVLANATGAIPQQPPTDMLKVEFVTGKPNPTTTAAITANVDSRQTVPSQSPFSANDPDTYNSSTAMTVYDSLGNPHTLSYYFVKSSSANQWDLYTRLDGTATNTISSPGNPPANPSGSLIYDSNGVQITSLQQDVAKDGTVTYYANGSATAISPSTGMYTRALTATTLDTSGFLSSGNSTVTSPVDTSGRSLYMADGTLISSLSRVESTTTPGLFTYYANGSATPISTASLYYRTLTQTTPDPSQFADTLKFTTSGTLTGIGSHLGGADITTGILGENFIVSTGAVTPLQFEVNLSNMTQFGSPFAVNDLTQNGFAPGNLAGVSVSKDGIVQARYDNGQTRDIGQIALFNFRNPNGLASIGNNQWTESADSGQPTPGNPNTGIFGVLQASAIEESNVDLTAELVNLIVQQRNYQASAQSIKTQDQILQTLVNIR